jgi:hypothetical protein
MRTTKSFVNFPGSQEPIYLRCDATPANNAFYPADILPHRAIFLLNDGCNIPEISFSYITDLFRRIFRCKKFPSMHWLSERQPYSVTFLSFPPLLCMN